MTGEGDAAASAKTPIEEALDPVRVGKQLRIWRAEQDMTQADVAQKIGVSAQQYQKYETGITRIGLSRLFSICTALDRSPSVFLDRAAEDGEETADLPANENREHKLGIGAGRPEIDGFLGPKLDLSFAVSDVVQNFMAINDPEDRNAVMFILRCYADKSRAKAGISR